MQETRSAPFDERRALYAEQRLNDQRRWYGSRARSHDQAREACFFLAILAQLGAVLVAISASVTAWAQAKRHEESAQAYALAKQELDVMAARLDAARDEVAFEAAVAETEAAISREHTMWMARRNR
jgi:hypothetical protein